MANKGQLNQKDLVKLSEFENNGQHILTIDPLKKLFRFYVSTGNRERAKETLYRMASNVNTVVHDMLLPLINQKIQSNLVTLHIADDLFPNDVFSISAYLQYVFSLSISDEWSSHFHTLIPSWKSLLKFILIDFTSMVEEIICKIIDGLSASLRQRIDVSREKVMSILQSYKLSLYNGFTLKDIYRFLITKLDLDLHDNEEYSYFLDRFSILELESGSLNFSVSNVSKSMIQYCWLVETSNIIDLSMVLAKFPDFFLDTRKYSYDANDPLVLTKVKYPCAHMLRGIYVFYSNLFNAVYNLNAHIGVEDSIISDLANQSYLHGLLGRSLDQQLLLSGGEYFSHLLGLLLIDSFVTSTRDLFLKISNDGLIIFKVLNMDLSVSLYSLNISIALSLASPLMPMENVVKCASLASVPAFPKAFESWNMGEIDHHLELMVLANSHLFNLYLTDISLLHQCSSIGSSKVLAFTDEINHLIGNLSRLHENSEYRDALWSILRLLAETSMLWVLYSGDFHHEPTTIDVLSEHLSTCFSLLGTIKKHFASCILGKFLPVLHTILLRLSMMLLGGPLLSGNQQLRLSQTFLLAKDSFVFPTDAIFHDKDRLRLSLRALSTIIDEKIYVLRGHGLYEPCLQFDTILACAYSIFSLYYLFLGIYSIPQGQNFLFMKKATDCASKSLLSLPGVINELSTYSLLLIYYFEWIHGIDKISVNLKELLAQIKSISIATSLKTNTTPTTSSFLLLKSKAQILLLHPQLMNDSISNAISSLQSALRSQPSHSQTWLLLADSYAINGHHVAAFKGYTKVLSSKSSTLNFGNLILKMATCLFKSKSYGLCLKFLCSLIDEFKHIDISFIEEENPFELPMAIMLNELEEYDKLKQILFESLLFFSKDLLDLGEIGYLLSLIEASYDLVPFLLEKAKRYPLCQRFSFIITIFDSKAVDILQKDKPRHIEMLCEKTRQACILVQSHQSLKHVLEHVPPSVPNHILLGTIKQEVKNCAQEVLASQNCKSILLLTKIYFDIDILEHNNQVTNWLELATSLILLDIDGIIDSNRISPCIFAILRGLCAVCIEQKLSTHSPAIWLTTGKWLITKNSMSLAQHSLMIALNLGPSQEQLAQLFSSLALIAFAVRDFEQCEAFSLKSKLADPHQADVDFFIDQFKCINSIFGSINTN